MPGIIRIYRLSAAIEADRRRPEGADVAADSICVHAPFSGPGSAPAQTQIEFTATPAVIALASQGVQRHIQRQHEVAIARKAAVATGSQSDGADIKSP